jgi:hypothetical protein
MPFTFEFYSEISNLEQYNSTLIVPCRFCPAASSAVKNNKPYFEFLRRFLKTDSYEKYIESLKSTLTKRGIKTDVFRSRLIHQFVLCMWTIRRRKRLLEKAKNYEALIVLGCEAATQTVRDSVRSTSCDVIQGLKSEGIMSMRPRFHFPCNLSLELQSISPVYFQDDKLK